MKKNINSLKQQLIKLTPRPTAAQASASLALGLFFGLTGLALIDSAGGNSYAIPTPPTVEVEAIAVNTTSYDYRDPSVLTPEDRGLYAMIDAAQARGDYHEADGLLAKLSNRRLMGYALANRYLDSNYKTSKEELTYWMTYFSDHPQAVRMASLARARGVAVSLPKTPEPLRGGGYSDHLGRSGMPDRWFSALGRWREGDYASAYTSFNALADADNLGDWQQAAAHFWAYRAANALEQSDDAARHLAAAAGYDTTFYGLLANATRGDTTLAAEAPEVSTHLRNAPRAIRASLLAQLDRKDEAEAELRALYAETSARERKGIVTLASELNLANLQMRLARAPGLSKAEANFARFPMPQYMLSLDSVMDASLVMAVARNESSFRDAVNKNSGARGMMQMLPSTARAVERHVGEELLRTASIDNFNDPVAERLSDPALSARYGAEYLKLLAKQPAIENNLIHLLIGYNAGPGTVANWKAAGRNVSDPLLYIESIPYGETRNYVMQVLAQYWTYQMMMDETPTSMKTIAQGKWPIIASRSN